MTKNDCHLDELGYYFVQKCIETVEKRGLDDQGLYRVSGVNSRVNRLLEMCLNKKNYNATTGQINMPNFSDPVEWETKTITSALKHYLRNLTEPLMTYNLHPYIIEAAKIQERQTRTHKIKSLIQQLPCANFLVLELLVVHLRNVSKHSQRNLMTISNLGICFAPTLMRGPDDSAPSIAEIRYSNVVTTTLIEEYDLIFRESRSLNTGPQKQETSYIEQLCYQSTPLTQLVSPPSMIQAPDKVMYRAPQMNAFGQIQMPPYCEQLHWQPNYPFYPLQPHKLPYQSDRVVSLYNCVADADSELSFGPNEVIIDVRPSDEVGWLIGTLERSGERGLLPQNYVKFI